MDNTIIQGKNPEQAPKKPRVNGINKGGDMEKLLLQNRFWLLGALSLLFIITFIYYLPLRFEQQASGNAHDDGTSAEHGHDAAAGAGAHANHALPTVESLEHLPLRTPADRVDRLSYELIDGIKVFLLEASEFRWEYEPGHWVHAWGYNGQIPGPEIRVDEGDDVRVIVTNNLPDFTTVHWHGLDVPWQADGVANITQEPIPPGGQFIYEFKAIPAGTRFYHTHGKNHITAAQQLDMGLSGAFIVEPAVRPYAYDKEFTLILDEWDILDGVNPAVAHVHGAGAEGAIPEYNTFTINGAIFPYIDPLVIKEGERVLIRFINAGTTAFHPMHLHGHSFDVIAKDGFSIERGAIETHNTITLHPGETVDILVRADNPGPWLLHCHHVHHASAGMITLLQYEGYEPVNNINAAVTISKQKGELTEGVLAGEQVIQSAHAHSDDAAPDEEDQDHHNEAPLANNDHHAGEEVEPHAHTAPSNRNAWWGLLAVSVVLMTLLGLGVNKYLKGT
jgi:FtsP/CotA-like multicopper oxidase with cupredoxin domain